MCNSEQHSCGSRHGDQLMEVHCSLSPDSVSMSNFEVKLEKLTYSKEKKYAQQRNPIPFASAMTSVLQGVTPPSIRIRKIIDKPIWKN